MSAAGSLAMIASLVRAAVGGKRPTSFAVLDTDAADYLDRQGHAVLIRRAGPSEYIIVPRVKR